MIARSAVVQSQAAGKSAESLRMREATFVGGDVCDAEGTNIQSHVTMFVMSAGYPLANAHNQSSFY
jgi:hypothetical protein